MPGTARQIGRPECLLDAVTQTDTGTVETHDISIDARGIAGRVREEKQPPTVTHGPVNDAMHAAILVCRESWADIVREWESTR